MRKKSFRRSVSIWALLVLTVSNSLLACFARSSMGLPKNPSVYAKAAATTSASKSLRKLSPISSSAGKQSDNQQISLSDSSPLPPGPFKSISFTGDALRFKLSRAGGVFVSPLTATLNGLAFSDVSIKAGGIKLILSGDPAGSNLISLFPNGGTAALVITNGDGTRQYWTLGRQGETVSVLAPSISDAGLGHGTPSSTITLSGSNFSPNAGDNTVIFRTNDSKEFRAPAIGSTATTLTAVMPLIHLGTPNTFYSGPLTTSIETAHGYTSNATQLTVDSLPNNSRPPGQVAQDFSQQMEELISEVEDSIASGLASQGMDAGAIQALRELPHAGIDVFRSVVNDALAGRKPTFLVSLDESNLPSPITIDKDHIDLLERIIVSSGISVKIASVIANHRREQKVLALASLACPLSDAEQQVITAARFYQGLSGLSSLLDVSSFIADIAGHPEIAFILNLADTVRLIVQTYFGFQSIKLLGLEITPVAASMPAGEKTNLIIMGRFGPAVGAETSLKEAIKAILEEIPAVKALRLLKPVVVKIVDAIVEYLIDRFGQRLNSLVPLGAERRIALSSNTTTVASDPALSLGGLCAGVLPVIGLRETNSDGVPLQVTAKFPLIEGDAGRASARVRVTGLPNRPPTAAFQMLPQGQSSGARENETLQIRVSPGALVNVAFSADLSFDPEGGSLTYLWRIDGQQVSSSKNFSHTIGIGSSQVSLTVADNRGAQDAASARIIVSPASQAPVAGFRMSASGIDKNESETLQLFAPAGQSVNVSFSAVRSYDPEGGPLTYAWRIDGGLVNTNRDFISALAPGTHLISLTVTDNQGQHSQISGTVIVTTQGASQPLISDISPISASVGVFDLTINGMNFNPANAEVVMTGPGCESGCVIPAASFKSKSPTQIVAAVQTSNAGLFSIEVRNGSGGTPSNGKPLTVTGTTSLPVINLSPTSLSFSVPQGSSGDAKILNISNASGGTLNWNASVSASGGSPWLSLSSNSGTAPSSTTVLVNSAGLSAGTYNGQVTVTANGAINNPQRVPVTLTVGNPPSPNPPSINSVSPNPVHGSNSPQPFTINGSNFVTNANIILRDLSAGQTFANRVPTSFSSTQIMLNVNFTTAAHNWSVEVINPDGQSSGQFNFQVTGASPPPPSISSVSPNPVPGSNSQQPFTINGTNFVTNANIILRDLSAGQTFQNRVPTSFSSTQIMLSVNFTTAAHNWSVEVINPDGQSSGQFNFSVTTPMLGPSINSVSPNPVPGSNSPQPFTINGANFVSGANITLRDLSAGQVFPNRVPTSFTNSQIMLSVNFTTAAHSWSVEVINPDGQSSGQFNFQVTSPMPGPSINSVSPNPVSGSNNAQPFTINGSNFISGANVTLRDLSAGQIFANRIPISFSSTQIMLSVNFTTAAHNWSVEVINPDGQSSGQFNFRVAAPTPGPSINGVSPNPVPGSNSQQPFTINGNNFVTNANIILRDLSAGQTFPNRVPTSFSSTQIILSVNFTTAAHNWSVEVINPDGQSSGQFNFQVIASTPPPSISSVSPSPVPGSNNAQLFTINGANFVSGANITLRDLSAGQIFPNRVPTSFGSTQIMLSVNFTTAAHNWSVEVINPDGQSSGQFNFQVLAPAPGPSISSVSPNPVPGSNSAQPFTINGANFVSGANIILRDLSAGQVFPNRTPVSFSTTQIMLSVNFTTAAHNWNVEVINPDGQSSGQFNFQVTGLAPPPSISSVSPNPVPGSNNVQPFTINGNNFVTNANIILRDLSAGQTFPNRIPTSFSSTQIMLNVNFTAAAHNWSVEVINPDGQSSGQFNFQVMASAPPPTINSVSPNPVHGSNSQQPFTINGSNFVTNANIILRDLSAGQVFPNRVPTSFSSTQIMLSVNFTAAAHNWSVEVINPDGQSSGQFNFQVTAGAAPPPSISSVSPNPVPGSSSQQPFTINGVNFVSGANIILRDLSAGQTFANRVPTSFSSTQIMLSVNFTTAAHNWSVEVINPDGQSSGQFNFQVIH